jgi:undecaprenyl-phosphate 4-deoxy-4-formamido-L-arabinose transferase
VAVFARLATGFSVRPLRLVTWCGLVLGALGGLLAVAVVAYRLAYPEQFVAAVAGWASLMVGLLVIGGVQMLFLGVIGEYVGRTHTAVAGRRPQATVRAVVRGGGG